MKEYRDELKRRWTPKNAAHEKAHTFICETWPKADLVKDKEVLEEAKKALEVCRDNKDGLAPQKLLQGAIDHAGELQKRKAALDLDASMDDRKTAEVIAERSQKLKELITAVQDYLQRASGEK